MLAFLTKLLDSVLKSQASKFITKEFWKLRTKLKSNSKVVKIIWYLEWLKEYTTTYFSDKEVNTATHYLKLTHNEEWWRWELQSKYSDTLLTSTVPYETPLEATNNAQKVLKGFTIVNQFDYKRASILWIKAPNINDNELGKNTYTL